MFALAQLPPPCPCGHTINFEKSEVFVPKSTDVRILKYPLVRKMSALNNSALTADVFYRRPLQRKVKVIEHLKMFLRSVRLTFTLFSGCI